MGGTWEGTVAGLGATCPIRSSSSEFAVLYVLLDLPYLCALSVLQLFCL